MKLGLIVTILISMSSIVYADYTVKNVYRFDNIDMIKSTDSSSIISLTVNGFSEDSNGNKATSKCLVDVVKGTISGHCEAIDQDGDIEYSTVNRNMSEGNVGILQRTGGTGKYANKTSVCEYTVELTDFKVGVGYLTASCKE